nr:DNA recombination protein RmuC [Rhizobiaceae bacterium]
MTFFLDLQQVLFTLADWPVTVAHALIAAGVVLAVLILWRIMAARVKARAHAETLAAAEARAREAEARMAQIAQTQSEMQGRMQTMAELFGARQAELNQSISQRLDAMTGRIGATMTEQTKSTHENLSKLQERLAAIDAAQTNIQQLAGQVVELQAILSNKQTRGAFGQSRMEAIVADGLPQGGYSFQATLSNGNRPDCLIAMPNGAASLVIDAKFPLEGWNAMRDAASDEQAQKIASQRFRRDVEVHVKAIAERYFIP